MMTTADIDRVLRDRSIWGAPYRNRDLENKRRSAIIWLRQRSAKGWILDHVMRRAA